IYSNLEPDPSDIYQAPAPDGPWTKLPRSQQGQPFTIVARTTTFGYFAAGYAATSAPPGAVTVGGGQLLPIIVAVLIVLVVLAGRAAPGPAADRIPGLPVDVDSWRPCLELFFEAPALLRRAHAELAVATQRLGLAVGRTKELDCFAPGALQRLLVDSRAKPAAAVEEVVPLLHQHLAQPVLQNLDRASDAGLDHHRECGVEDRVGSHELAPLAPGLVEV